MFQPLIFTGGIAMTNGYLLGTITGHLLIDAPQGTLHWVQKMDIKPHALLLTHQHFDHVHDAGAIQSWADCPIYAFSPFDETLTLGPLLRNLGMDLEVDPYVVNHVLKDSTFLPIREPECLLFHIPGHSPDSVAFYFPGMGCVFSGDTLMAGGVGRTDFPGGSWDLLLKGIRAHLLALPGSTTVYSGHGEPSSIGGELASNPFLSRNHAVGE